MSEGSLADAARHTVTPHIVVRGAGTASEWYQRALGAEERGRIPVPGGRFMQIELRFGDSTVMIADEFPELDVLSPLSVGGTVGALAIHTDDVDMLWRRALEAGAKVSVPLQEMFWGDRHGEIFDPFGHRWGLPNTSATSRPRRSGRRQRRCSEATRPDPGQGGSHQRKEA
jgi:PhnB protein